MSVKNVFISLVLSLALFAEIANAQAPGGDLIALTSSPESPSPGETITVTAGTPTFDKNTAFFEWVVNGEVRKDFSGPAKNSITITAGELGSAAAVEVNVIRKGGGGNAKIEIPVSDLTLTWFAETYIPKWYKGRALPTQSSVISIVAIPQIVLNRKPIPAENLIYSWSFDDEENVRKGIGVQTFRIKTASSPRITHEVGVVIEDVEKRIVKSGGIFIVPSLPKVSIYNVSPLGGIEYRSAKSVFAADSGGFIDFQAEPFFFPVPSKKELGFEWAVAGQKLSGSPQNPSILSIDTRGQGSGLATISVGVQKRGSFNPIIKFFNLLLR